MANTTKEKEKKQKNDMVNITSAEKKKKRNYYNEFCNKNLYKKRKMGLNGEQGLILDQNTQLQQFFLLVNCRFYPFIVDCFLHF